MTPTRVFLDCTLRDGGYYNAWDFPAAMVQEYLRGVEAAGVDVVELGFRSLTTHGFRGACAYTTDEYIGTLDIPAGLRVGVMVNASEVLAHDPPSDALERLFPRPAGESPVSLVRIACHAAEFPRSLPLSDWLAARGYQVGFNLMQVSDCSAEDIRGYAAMATAHPIDVLYFADSLGSMDPDHVARVTGWFREGWQGPIGVHMHDNLGLALQNSLRALQAGATWVDATVTGMGRGPGNAKTEQLAIEMAALGGNRANIVELLGVIRRHFEPMQVQCKWGTNPFYYLAGKYGIHPTYIQEMLSDSRYSDEDILSSIEQLRGKGAKKFSKTALGTTRNFYQGDAHGKWRPAEAMSGRDVMVLGSGPGAARYRSALERYIARERPVVLALNTQSPVAQELIDYRVACHPIRLLADCGTYGRLRQPLVTPFSMLPEELQASLENVNILDFGMTVRDGQFACADTHCLLPTSLVIGYALAVATAGKARRLLLAGFDGYGPGDRRTTEVEELFMLYAKSPDRLDLLSVTPSAYSIPATSIFAI